MTKAKHTPGPWSVPHFADDSSRCNCQSVVGMHGGMGGICRVEFDNGLPISEGGNDAPDLEQAKANARLIAAAPDLLEALEDMLAQADFAASVRGGEGHMKHAMAKARAAIAKAKGE